MFSNWVQVYRILNAWPQTKHLVWNKLEYIMSYSSPKWSTDAAFIAYMDMVAKDANMIYIVARTAGRFNDSKASVSIWQGSVN